jgi:phage terminase large subunit
LDATQVIIPYAPRPLQLQIHQRLDEKRFGAVVCHRRFGKTVLAINQLIKSAATCEKERPRFGYIAPTLKQAKAVAWDYLKHYTDPIPGVSYNETELRADLPNEARIRLFGADNPDSLRGIYLDGVVLDEFPLMQGRTWSEVIRPLLADRMGWALFIGTPNGKNAFWDIYQQATADNWFRTSYKASETGVIDAAELKDAARMMTEDEYAQEFECSFEASVRGAVYAKELAQVRAQKRIARVPYDPILPVHTAWDLGVGDATAIWFAQVHGAERRIIDYYEASGEGLQHYAAILDKKGYKYGRHLAPPDIEVRELGSGRSRKEIAAGLGIKFEVVKGLRLEDGINAARMLLPTCYFDEDKCSAGIEALQNYRWDFNQRLDEFKSSPVHDWASHGADAFRYLALGLKQLPENKPLKINTQWVV